VRHRDYGAAERLPKKAPMVLAGENQDARVITISATYGAGGSAIAPRVAARLGLPFADRLVPARDPGATASGQERLTQDERDQVAKQSLLARLVHVTGGLGLPVPSGEDLADGVRARVEASVVAIVKSGGGVVLGRAAAIVLADHPAVLHVRLDGPVERRVVHAMVLEQVDTDTARSRMEETDRARAQYVSRLYGRAATDPSLYHLVIDPTVLGVDATVDLIAGAASAFWARSQMHPLATAEGS
jgi:cytidylate kinase